MEEVFLDKHCQVVKVDGFTLYGTVKEVNDYGILLETTQETSYISFSNIKEIRINRSGY